MKNLKEVFVGEKTDSMIRSHFKEINSLVMMKINF